MRESVQVNGSSDQGSTYDKSPVCAMCTASNQLNRMFPKGFGSYATSHVEWVEGSLRSRIGPCWDGTVDIKGVMREMTLCVLYTGNVSLQLLYTKRDARSSIAGKLARDYPCPHRSEIRVFETLSVGAGVVNM